MHSFCIRNLNKQFNLWTREEVKRITFLSSWGSFSSHATSKRSSDIAVCFDSKTWHEFITSSVFTNWVSVFSGQIASSDPCCIIWSSEHICLSPMRTGMKLDKPDSFSTCKKEGCWLNRKLNLLSHNLRQKQENRVTKGLRSLQEYRSQPTNAMLYMAIEHMCDIA